MFGKTHKTLKPLESSDREVFFISSLGPATGFKFG